MSNTSLFIGGIISLSFFVSLLLLAQSVVSRVIASAITLSFSAYCAYGYLASFELSGVAGLPWKITYAVIGICSLITAVILIKSIFSRAKS